MSLGDVPFALGTDTAGSGRIPAAFNNVVGLKPTLGRVSTRGVVPACRSLDCVSVFALSVVDAARVLAAIEGEDRADDYNDFAPGPARGNDRLRIGVVLQASFDDDSYRAAYDNALGVLDRLGHDLVPIDLAPLHAIGEQLYGGPWVAERHAVIETLLARRPEAIEDTVRSVIERARGMTATDAFRGLYGLRHAQRETQAIWDGVDMLMLPSAPGHPRHAEVDADPVGVNNRLGLYTSFVNLLGWCALAVPAGFCPTACRSGSPSSARARTTPCSRASARAGRPSLVCRSGRRRAPSTCTKANSTRRTAGRPANRPCRSPSSARIFAACR